MNANLSFDLPIHAESVFTAADEACFLLLLTCQARFNLPQHAHSFAAFARLRRDGGRACLEADEAFVISWLPRKLEVTLMTESEPGVNFDLPATLKWASERGACTSAWGPFHVQEALYARAAERRAFLESDVPRFVILDAAYRPRQAINCIHAISDLDLTVELLDTGLAWGRRANRILVDYFRPWMIAPSRTHS